MIQQLGPYKVDRLLGSGGMGAVHAGVDKAGNPVAIKVLARLLGENDAFRNRFTAEIETLKKLDHLNIVRILGYGEHDGQLFYSMELVEGGSLHDVMKRGKLFTWRDVTKIAIQVCQALKHAHDHGVVHRDLKPANLMLTRDGDIKVLDFGIAKLFGGTDVTAVGSVVGTADFMAPEQSEDAPVTPRTDLYSLGSVMFALLTRRPPFTGASAAEVIHKLKYEEPPGVREFVPAVPVELEKIISQLLEKSPEKRFSSAYILSNCLKAMEFGLKAPDGEPIEMTPLSIASAKTEIDNAVDTPQHTQINTSVRNTADFEADEDEGEDTRPKEPEVENKQASRETDTGASGAEQDQQGRSDSTRFDDGSARASQAREKRNYENRFTEVDEEVRRKALQLDVVADSAWMVKFGGLLVAVLGIGGYVWWITRPLSPEQLYDKIEAEATTGDAQDLLACEPHVDSFLEMYPENQHSPKVREFKQLIELTRFSNRMNIRRKRLPPGESLHPAEQLFLHAIRVENENPELALARLKALVVLFDKTENQSDANSSSQDGPTAHCVTMAREKIKKLQTVVDRSISQQALFIGQKLSEASKLRKERPQQAIDMYEAIIVVYGDQDWAQELVSQARSHLVDIRATVAASGQE